MCLCTATAERISPKHIAKPNPSPVRWSICSTLHCTDYTCWLKVATQCCGNCCAFSLLKIISFSNNTVLHRHPPKIGKWKSLEIIGSLIDSLVEMWKCYFIGIFSKKKLSTTFRCHLHHWLFTANSQPRHQRSLIYSLIHIDCAAYMAAATQTTAPAIHHSCPILSSNGWFMFEIFRKRIHKISFCQILIIYLLKDVMKHFAEFEKFFRESLSMIFC